MSEKIAIVVLSDPRSAADEALGRLFNALFVAYELKEKRREVALVFQGAGVRWPAELVKAEHPAHDLYRAVADTVAGICGGCADAFGASAELRAAGLELVRQREIPGTSGVIDLSQYIDDGYRLLIF